MSIEKKAIKITVIGGGNIGTQFACMCAAKGYNVNVFCSKAKQFSDEIEIVNEFEEITCGKISLVTSNLKEAINGCQIVLVTYPAFKLAEIADKMFPFIENGMCICVIPGTGGAEFTFRKCIQAGATLLGLQRVPSVARLEQYGKRVRCEGLRKELFIASVPSVNAEQYCSFFESLWDIPCKPLPNYLNVTLTPSNPILHTTRLKTLFEDYKTGVFYENNPLFYGDWSDKSSELLLTCDDELQKICHKLDKMDLTYVRSLKIHYESETVQAMTQKISTIKSLHDLCSPMIKTDKGWLPDFSSRYFTADFPFGLAIIEEFANIVGIDVPNIHETFEWYKRVSGDYHYLKLSEFGLNTLDDIYTLYS
ncbi:MAG: NAD/NADP octopine/nopaline dehydrogenase family protein [Ruminococcus sp.]|nr:NAD/NADP octopine/nopaline dehydrogenase family protein [Ruminococcus sp.]